MNEDFVFIQLKADIGRGFVVDSNFSLEITAEGAILAGQVVDLPVKVTRGEWNVILNKTGLFEEAVGPASAGTAVRGKKSKAEN